MNEGERWAVEIRLERWLTEHHDPAWKYKPYKAPRPSKARALSASSRIRYRDMERSWLPVSTETIRQSFVNPKTLKQE